MEVSVFVSVGCKKGKMIFCGGKRRKIKVRQERTGFPALQQMTGFLASAALIDMNKRGREH